MIEYNVFEVPKCVYGDAMRAAFADRMNQQRSTLQFRYSARVNSIDARLISVHWKLVFSFRNYILNQPEMDNILSVYLFLMRTKWSAEIHPNGTRIE